MTLNNSDSTKLNYKAQIEWYRERIAALSQGFENPVAAIKDPDPDAYLTILNDLYNKTDKLDKRIDAVSAGLKIPIDVTGETEVAAAAKALDPSSGGEFISYELYKKSLEQLNAGKDNLTIDDLIPNSSDDATSNSQLIQDRIYTGYASYQGESSAKDNYAQRYVNSYLNSIVNWNENDYQIRQIINFSDNYLGKFPDPAYLPWSFKEDTLFEKTQISGYQDMWKGFSEAGKGEMSRVGGAFKDLTALRPDKNMASLTDRYLDYTNKFLNGLDNLFNEGWSADLVCCFIKFTKRLDTKTLKGLRGMLQLLKFGFNYDFDDIKNSFKDILNNIMRGLILNQLMGLINQLIQRLVDPIKRWINNPEDKTWQKIFECTPLRQLITRYLTDAVDYAQKFFEDLLKELYKDNEMQKIYKDAKLTQAKENKWINRALKLIDIVIAIMELSASCATDGTPNAEDVQKMIDKATGDEETYEYPVDAVPNIYNSFITEEQQKKIEALTESGATNALTTVVSESAAAQRAAISSRADDCRKNITDTDMPPSIVWLEELMKNS